MLIYIPFAQMTTGNFPNFRKVQSFFVEIPSNGFPSHVSRTGGFAAGSPTASLRRRWPHDAGHSDA